MGEKLKCDFCQLEPCFRTGNAGQSRIARGTGAALHWPALSLSVTITQDITHKRKTYAETGTAFIIQAD